MQTHAVWVLWHGGDFAEGGVVTDGRVRSTDAETWLSSHARLDLSVMR